MQQVRASTEGEGEQGRGGEGKGHISCHHTQATQGHILCPLCIQGSIFICPLYIQGNILCHSQGHILCHKHRSMWHKKGTFCAGAYFMLHCRSKFTVKPHITSWFSLIRVILWLGQPHILKITPIWSWVSIFSFLLSISDSWLSLLSQVSIVNFGHLYILKYHIRLDQLSIFNFEQPDNVDYHFCFDQSEHFLFWILVTLMSWISLLSWSESQFSVLVNLIMLNTTSVLIRVNIVSFQFWTPRQCWISLLPWSEFQFSVPQSWTGAISLLLA